jgi:hypothetical protein
MYLLVIVHINNQSTLYKVKDVGPQLKGVVPPPPWPWALLHY